MPLALLAGVNTSLPALMSATLITSPAATAPLFAAPVSVSVPALGNVVSLTAASVLAVPEVVSCGSAKPKLAALSACVASSLSVSVASVPAGASFTPVTSKPSV